MEKSPYSVSIHGTVHGWSIHIVAIAVYMYGVKLLTNEFRRISSFKTPEHREAIVEHKEPGGGTHHVTECTKGAVIIILITDNCHIMLTIILFIADNISIQIFRLISVEQQLKG